MFKREDYMLVEEVAKELECTAQNVYQSIWRGHLRSIKYDGFRWVKREWLEEWRSHWRSKQHSWYQGRPTFDVENGELSARMAAEILKCKESRIYYLVKMGFLPCKRKGNYVVIYKDDLLEYMQEQKTRRYA